MREGEGGRGVVVGGGVDDGLWWWWWCAMKTMVVWWLYARLYGEVYAMMAMVVWWLYAWWCVGCMHGGVLVVCMVVCWLYAWWLEVTCRVLLWNVLTSLCPLSSASSSVDWSSVEAPSADKMYLRMGSIIKSCGGSGADGDALMGGTKLFW